MDPLPSIWVDFENAPHVWVLSSVIEHFQRRGYGMIFTARDFSCTPQLAERLGYPAQVVGQAVASKSQVAKVGHVVRRAGLLWSRVFPERSKIALALSHGSRSQALAAYTLRIPTVSLDDYECSYQGFARFANYTLVPFPIPREVWGRYASRIVHYPGFKEELYLWRFNPAENAIPEIQRETDRIWVLFRPEGRFAHYGSEKSALIQQQLLDYFATESRVGLVLLARDAIQAEMLEGLCREKGLHYWVPDRILDGPSLIWQMDLVVGGGGTMTREAAVLGVPAYSFFAGAWGGVDRYLEREGRLVRIAEPEEASRVVLGKRKRRNPQIGTQALAFVIAFLEKMLNA